MSATDRGQQQERQDPAGFNLLGSMLSGLLGEPTRRGELTEAFQRPAGLDSIDDVDKVGVGVDAEDDAIIHEGECSGEPLAAADGPGEEKVRLATAKGLILRSQRPLSISNRPSSKQRRKHGRWLMA